MRNINCVVGWDIYCSAQRQRKNIYQRNRQTNLSPVVGMPHSKPLDPSQILFDLATVRRAPTHVRHLWTGWFRGWPIRQSGVVGEKMREKNSFSIFNCFNYLSLFHRSMTLAVVYVSSFSRTFSEEFSLFCWKQRSLLFRSALFQALLKQTSEEIEQTRERYPRSVTTAWSTFAMFQLMPVSLLRQFTEWNAHKYRPSVYKHW